MLIEINDELRIRSNILVEQRELTLNTLNVAMAAVMKAHSAQVAVDKKEHTVFWKEITEEYKLDPNEKWAIGDSEFDSNRCYIFDDGGEDELKAKNKADRELAASKK